MNKKFGLITIVCFIVFFSAIAVLYAACPDMGFSDSENRALAQKPPFKLEDFASFDEYSAAMDSYLADQFPYRLNISESSTMLQRRLGRRVIKGMQNMSAAGAGGSYYIGEEFMFKNTYAIESVRYPKLLKALDKLEDMSGADVVYVALPLKNIGLYDGTAGQLSADVDKDNLNKIAEAVNASKADFIDVCTHFLDTSGPEVRSKMYFKTDFHWNEIGAFAAAEYITDQLKKLNLVNHYSYSYFEDFDWKRIVDRKYLGDIARGAGMEASDSEDVRIYVPKDCQNYVYYKELKGAPVLRSEIIATGLSDASDKALPLDYNTLTTANLRYLRIENPNAEVKKTVLVLKDSYWNPMTDYFSNMFSEINVVDPRYCQNDIHSIIEARKPDLILLTYHNNNISSELLDYIDGIVQPPLY